MKVEMGPFPSLYEPQLDLFGNDYALLKQKVVVELDPWDTWNVDVTLAHIIVPMLKQLKETKNGAPYVDPLDVPDGLRPDPVTDEFDTDGTHFERWDWVLDEMIFAFESKLFDWEEQFWKEYPVLDWKDGSDVDANGHVALKWTNPGVFDTEGHKEYQTRVSNGFRLFGRYYDGLWD